MQSKIPPGYKIIETKRCTVTYLYYGPYCNLPFNLDNILFEKSRLFTFYVELFRSFTLNRGGLPS